MAQRIGKYKLSKKEQAIYEHDVDTATFSEIDITGTFEADGLCSAKGGLTVTGAALTVTGVATSLVNATASGTLTVTGNSGFYGESPVAQAAHIADPASTTGGNNAAIDAILVVLENLGFVAKS